MPANIKREASAIGTTCQLLSDGGYRRWLVIAQSPGGWLCKYPDAHLDPIVGQGHSITEAVIDFREKVRERLWPRTKRSSDESSNSP